MDRPHKRIIIEHMHYLRDNKKLAFIFVPGSYR